MKYILITLLTILLFSTLSFSQDCVAGPPITCGVEKVITPAVTPPSSFAVVSSTCSTLVAKWSGAANQQYVVSTVNNTTGATEIVPATNITCDAAYNCTATMPVKAGNQYRVLVEAKAIISSCTYYSYPAILQLASPVPACIQPANTVNTTTAAPDAVQQNIREKAADRLKVYPNPAKNTLNIVLPEAAQAASIRLLTTEGKTVMVSEGRGRNRTLNVQALPAGVYTVQVMAKDGTSLTVKVVLE